MSYFSYVHYGDIPLTVNINKSSIKIMFFACFYLSSNTEEMWHLSSHSPACDSEDESHRPQQSC